MAQLGRAPGSGPGGRGFKSHQPDFCKVAVSIRVAGNVPACVKHWTSDKQTFGKNAFTMMAAQRLAADAFPCHDRRATHGNRDFVLRPKVVLALRRCSGIRVGRGNCAAPYPRAFFDPGISRCSRLWRARSAARALSSESCGRSSRVFGGRLSRGCNWRRVLYSFCPVYTIIFLVGGIIGTFLLLAVFDWALIVVSSLIGAHLIQSAIVLPPTGSTIVLIGFAIIGILVQAASFRRS